MNDFGGGTGVPVRRSRLAEYAEMTERPPRASLRPAASKGAEETESPDPLKPHRTAEPSEAEVAERRREFAALLEAFRSTAVLVPLQSGGWLTTDFGGVRWILAFSDESALARYALARDEAHREWTYQTVLGARLLDVAVPEAGMPCGVALDAADDAEHAALFPPVSGVVPDAFAVDRTHRGGASR